MFYGRTEELKSLHQMARMPGFNGAIVYGRRRFGKTTLIKEFAKQFDGPFIYYQCLRASDSINAKGLIQAVKDVLDNVTVSQNSSFTEVLNYLFHRADHEKMLLVLDEYPYLSGRITIDTELQSYIDQHRDQSKMKMILAGSSVSIMVTLLDVSNPLHGRYPYQIKVDAFDYRDAASFYPDAPLEDKIAYYSVFGGIPYYLSLIDPQLGFEENLKTLLLSEFAPLESEIHSTMKEEYGKIENATVIMDALSRGLHSYQDIKRAFENQNSRSDFSYAINSLIDFRFVDKSYAINDHTKKHAYYTISDNLFAFYYEMIFPNLSRRALLNVDTFYDLFIKEKLFNSFIPKRFEMICTEFLVRQNKNGAFDPVLENLGPYTYNDSKNRINGQFDIVGDTKNGPIFFECKYTKSKVGHAVYHEEIEQIKKAGFTPYRLGFFSRSGFEDFAEKKDCYCFELSDLYR